MSFMVIHLSCRRPRLMEYAGSPPTPPANPISPHDLTLRELNETVKHRPT